MFKKLCTTLISAAFLVSMLGALSCLGCSQGAEPAQEVDEDVVTMESVTDDDLNAAFYLMATAISVDSPMDSVYIEGNSDAKEVRATFSTQEDGSNARPLADEAEDLCAQYSLAVAQAALQRVQVADEPDQDLIEQWQAIVDAEEQLVESGDGAGSLFDYYDIIAVVQTSDDSVTLDGERAAGADSTWTWQ